MTDPRVSETVTSVPGSSFCTVKSLSLPASHGASINYNCTSRSCLSHYKPITVSLILAGTSAFFLILHTIFLYCACIEECAEADWGPAGARVRCRMCEEITPKVVPGQ